jgi:hypothetical protein
LEGLWVRSWLFEEKTWRESDDADQAKLLQDGGLVQLELAPQSNSLCALQLGGHFESRFLVVPPQGVSRVLITPPLTARADEAPGYDVDVTISMANSVADHLSQFLCAGSPSAWDGLDRKLVQGEGMALLDGKRSDPLGAAVGGYILLQGSSSPPPLSWLRNLTNVAPWLADGPILCAHAALKYRRRDAVDESIEYLLKASERAYPVLRRGIDLFLDTLRLLRSSKISLPDEIEAQADLYAAARGATTRQTAFTGFLGELPWSPLGFDRVQSRPGRQRHAGNASSRSPRRL